jgi:histone H3/H4
MKVYKGNRKKKQEDMSETLTRAGIERLMRGVSKTNIGDIEDLKFAKQLKTELKKKDIKKWLLDTGRSLKKKLLRS